MLDRETVKRLLATQKTEITEHLIYKKLSESIKDVRNKSILQHISDEEFSHHNVWRDYTHKEVEANKLKVWLYFLISKIFGITFGVKLMEMGERRAQITYKRISESVPAAAEIIKEEHEHEKELISLINEDRVKHMGDIVRGLNVALVELTGTLAGLTLALPDKSLIIVTGLIVGVVMSFSVASTEYLATRTEEPEQNPLKPPLYAGVANLLTVLFLIFPYLAFTNIYISLGVMLFNAIIVILIFTFYISVAKDVSFRNRFIEMALISLGIAGLAFGVGFLAKTFLNIHI